MTVIAVILVFGFFTYNAQVNMENRGIDFGYGFLSQESSFDVQFSLIEYDGSHSYARAYLVGLLNTLLVAFLGNSVFWSFKAIKAKKTPIVARNRKSHRWMSNYPKLLL